MGNGNGYLINARKGKNDEFYTQYADIESECEKFADRFSGKVIYCPCDNERSNFPKYFKDNYHRFGLSGLYYTSINGNAHSFDGNDDSVIGGPVSIVGDGLMDGGVTFLGILEKSDMVVTNPPFSLFVPFINSLVKSGKDFLVVGNQNSVSVKSVFEHIVGGRLHIDYGFKGLAGYFFVPDTYEDRAVSGYHREGMIRVSGVVWYTSFDTESGRDPIPLERRYYGDDAYRYPKYDNFREISGIDEDCIEVARVKDIPCDYYGYMGVPISFMGKYTPRQFEIIQLDHYGPLGNQDNMVNGKPMYRRIYIRRVREYLV